jgi:hypothetical protein
MFSPVSNALVVPDWSPSQCLGTQSQATGKHSDVVYHDDLAVVGDPKLHAAFRYHQFKLRTAVSKWPSPPRTSSSVSKKERAKETDNKS